MIDERPIGEALDRSLGSASAPGESVEADLDAFISRRHEQRVKVEGERDIEAAWRESERRHEAARRAANRSEWHVMYHLAAAERLRAILGSLIAHHEEQAQR